jgi:hypothetical protein
MDYEKEICETLKYFEYAHLPEYLQKKSKIFYSLAFTLVNYSPCYNSQLLFSLQHLLISKDAAIRSFVSN